MKTWNVLNGMLLVGILLLTTNCTQKEEHYVVKAVKDYRVAGHRVETLIELQTEVLQRRQKDLKLSWSEKQIDEHRFMDRGLPF